VDPAARESTNLGRHPSVVSVCPSTLEWSPLGGGTQLTDPNKAVPREVGEAAAADLRARLNDELGFYPARLDDESIAEYRRRGARDREQIEGYRRMYGSSRSSHWNQFRHLAKGREPRVRRCPAGSPPHASRSP